MGLGSGYDWTRLSGLSGSAKPKKGARGQFVDTDRALIQKDDSLLTPTFARV